MSVIDLSHLYDMAKDLKNYIGNIEPPMTYENKVVVSSMLVDMSKEIQD